MPPTDPPSTWLINWRLEIGRRIRAQRLWANLTQEQLAARVGVDRQTIVRVELGITSPPVDRLLQIARALDVPPASLMPEE